MLVLTLGSPPEMGGKKKQKKPWAGRRKRTGKKKKQNPVINPGQPAGWVPVTFGKKKKGKKEKKRKKKPHGQTARRKRAPKKKKKTPGMGSPPEKSRFCHRKCKSRFCRQIKTRNCPTVRTDSAGELKGGTVVSDRRTDYVN